MKYKDNCALTGAIEGTRSREEDDEPAWPEPEDGSDIDHAELDRLRAEAETAPHHETPLPDDEDRRMSDIDAEHEHARINGLPGGRVGVRVTTSPYDVWAD